jgi:tRNA(His) 5'-end guanylyltransferase
MGDRMKGYESATDYRLSRELPIIARLDGKGFSKWTADLKRPFDETFHNVMVETAKFLAEKTHAKAAYTQSDEITLGWINETEDSQVWFDGRVMKMASVLASMAASKFNDLYRPSDLDLARGDAMVRPLAFFDCRVWSVPNIDEAANAFLWREFDCKKNAISQACRHYYSHNQMNNKNGEQMIEMLAKAGVKFEDYPAWARRGTYIFRRIVDGVLSPQELEKIPEKFRPNGPVLRTRYVVENPPNGLQACMNRVGVLFKGEPRSDR